LLPKPAGRSSVEPWFQHTSGLLHRYRHGVATVAEHAYMLIAAPGEYGCGPGSSELARPMSPRVKASGGKPGHWMSGVPRRGARLRGARAMSSSRHAPPSNKQTLAGRVVTVGLWLGPSDSPCWDSPLPAWGQPGEVVKRPLRCRPFLRDGGPRSPLLVSSHARGRSSSSSSSRRQPRLPAQIPAAAEPFHSFLPPRGGQKIYSGALLQTIRACPPPTPKASI
jgi:hypothetical protein